MQRLNCEKCGHQWLPRIKERPLSCPKCKSPSWDKLGYLPCEVCRKKYFHIHIHHKDGNRNNNTKDNLINVCQYCHAFIHHGLETSTSKRVRMLKGHKLRTKEVILRLKKLRKFWKEEKIQRKKDIKGESSPSLPVRASNSK